MKPVSKIVLIGGLCSFAVGCATSPNRVQVPAPLPTTSSGAAADAGAAINGDVAAGRALRQTSTPSLPPQGADIANAEVKISEPPLAGPDITASLADMPLPAFINEVFGNLLHVNFQLDPALVNKTDLVTLRLPGPQSPRDFYHLAEGVLREYGVGLSWDGSVLAIAPRTEAQGKEPPLVISGRALPDVPISHRPVFQLVELQAVRNRDVTGWLKMAYESDDLKINEDPNRNAIVLFGKPDLVTQAVAAIKVLDRPFMRGRYSTRLEPAFVGASELATRLMDVLNAEGYSVGKDPTAASSTTLVLPVPSANVVLVFSADQEVLAHVVDWARSIDKPNENASGSSLFYYQVRNTKASDVANVLRGLEGGGNQAQQAAQSGGSSGPTNTVNAGSGGRGGGAGGNASQSLTLSDGGRLTIDAPRNAIIYQGDASAWQRVLGVIRQMDKPARQVMIEVTIAEITLTNDESFGVSWLAKEVKGTRSSSLSQGTFGAASGLTYLLDIRGENRAQLKALSKDSRVSILSTPRLLVKSGEEGSIDVGTEVPTITSQTTSSQQTDGNTALLQSIEYRKTGIQLTVKPTVYSDNRIDLDISQEVSDALSLDANTVVTSTPSIFDRSVKTSLSLRDGGSVMIGGLISERLTHSSDGVPGLKKVPLLGNLFQSKSNKKERTELVLIIVPYVIETDQQAQAITEAIGDRLRLIDLPKPAVQGPAAAPELPVSTGTAAPAASDAAVPAASAAPTPSASAPAAPPTAAPTAAAPASAPTHRVRARAGAAALAAPEPSAATPTPAPSSTP